ncbi:MAG: peptide-methionine (S)-S-oxide reductase [Faecalibacterium prausnitzii]|nr:peptide-methionine (S)-S-oxide reductase [Faecalibacterium prausnitzii]
MENGYPASCKETVNVGSAGQRQNSPAAGKREETKMETVYIAGGCLWGVQHFFDTVPGVQRTEAGRANGRTNSLDGPYDGYAECVKVVFDERCTDVPELMTQLFEIIDPYSRNKQGVDVGEKYRTGLYSTEPRHLEEARNFIDHRKDRDRIVVEVLPLTNYVRSAEEHQHHLERYPEDCSYCHIPDAILNKYRKR